MFERWMGLKAISPAELFAWKQREAVTILDVNSSQSWHTAHVPGAVHLDPAEFSQDDLPADRNAMLVFYCSNFLCRKAPNAARRAKGMGYGNVYVMSAGISGWQSASLPTESGEPPAKAEPVSLAGA